MTPNIGSPVFVGLKFGINGPYSSMRYGGTGAQESNIRGQIKREIVCVGSIRELENVVITTRKKDGLFSRPELRGKDLNLRPLRLWAQVNDGRSFRFKAFATR